jgi:hypothetical protein
MSMIQLVMTVGPGSKDPGFEPRGHLSTRSVYLLTTCSPLQLDWFGNGRCRLPVTHAPKIPELPIRAEVGITGPQWRLT